MENTERIGANTSRKHVRRTQVSEVDLDYFLGQSADTGDADAFWGWMNQAKQKNRDINDWLEQTSLPIIGYDPTGVLEEQVMPYIKPNSNVCEIGPGSGRFSRYLAEYLTKGNLHLVDNSRFLISFLTSYFRNYRNVYLYQNDSKGLSMFGNNTLDLIFSGGVFVELRQSTLFSYITEAFRCLKPGGHLVFDFIDISTKKGVEFFLFHEYDSGGIPNCYTYYHRDTIKQLASLAGFKIICFDEQGEGNVYVIMRKYRNSKNIWKWGALADLKKSVKANTLGSIATKIKELFICLSDLEGSYA